MSGMTISAASVIPRATATVLSAFMVRSSVRWVGDESDLAIGRGRPPRSGAGGLGLDRDAETRSLGDERRDVVAGELGQDVAPALLSAHEEPDDERAILLEEEDVARLLLVHVPADDPQGRLVEAGVTDGLRSGLAASRDRFLHEPGDVVIEEGEGLLGLMAHGLRPGPAGRARGHDPLDDEPV